jgi:hypothetical protein
MKRPNRQARKSVPASQATATVPIGGDTETEPLHVLLSPNIGGILGVAMAGCDVKSAAEVLALLYDAATSDGVTPKAQAILWKSVIHTARDLWRTGDNLYSRARAIDDAATSSGGAK